MLIASAAKVREIEKRAMADGLSAGRLMENAGTAAARSIRAKTAQPMDTVILCGAGNNGGDGFVIARKLYENDYSVTVVLTDGVPKTDTAREAYSKIPADIPRIDATAEPYRAASVVAAAHVVVDAVYGIGFRGALPHAVAQLFAVVTPRHLTFAVDIPSGLLCDSGDADADTFKANYTLTFIAAKPALLMPQNAAFCGQVTVLSIGIEETDIAAVLDTDVLKDSDIKPLFVPREPNTHKGTYGHLLAVCGSFGMAGAAILSVRAALRSGVGLVTVALPRSIYPIVATAVPEAVFLPLPETEDGVLSRSALRPLLSALENKDALLIGCGLGKGESVELLVCELLSNAKCPVLLDADGLNAVAKHIDVLKTVLVPLVLTPHPGEMARLCASDIAFVEADRLNVAQSFAARYGVTLALKGHRTVVTDGVFSKINATGNAGMATGGSGDVLAGMIASLMAQGMHPMDAAKSGVYLHGKAGDAAAKRLSQHALLPSDMLDELGGLFLELE